MLSMKKRLCFCALLVSLFLLSSCSGRVANPIVKIGDHSFSTDFYRYLYLNFEEEMPDAEEAEIHQTVLAELREVAAVYEMADNYDIRTEASGKDAYEAMLESDFEGDEAALEAALEQAHMDRKLFETAYELQAIEEAVYFFVVDEANGIIHASDEILLKDISTNFFHASHILIRFDNHDAKEECLALAQQALDRVNKGKDFAALIVELGEDEFMLNNPDGYYFTHDEFEVMEFEKTVKELEIGQTSGIVESPYGYHIIKRLPLEEDYINENLESLRASFCTRKYYEFKANLASGFTVSYTDAFETFSAEAE